MFGNLSVFVYLFWGDMGMIAIHYQIIDEIPSAINQYELKYPFSSKIVGLDPQTLHPLAIDLKPAGEFEFRLGKRYCTTCLDETDGQPCKRCQKMDWMEELPVRIRSLCNYREPEAPLMRQGHCTYANYPCGYIQNRDVCHGTYFLYFGRFNSLFKVGISRSARTKKKRLVEQGLNEAYILSPIGGLPKALRLEELISETLGVPDRLHADAKVKSFESTQHWNWTPIHEFLLEVQNLFQIDHIKIQEDFRTEHLLRMEVRPRTVISGTVLWIQGSWMIFLDEEGQHRILNLKELEGYEIGGI